MRLSRNITGVIKSRRVRWMGDVVGLRKTRNACKNLVGKS
jgi:hypothetical protein